MNFPTVIWMGREPLAEQKEDKERAAQERTPGRKPKPGPSRFRVVHRGPARVERPDDVPFALERRTGQSMMKRLNWGPPLGEQFKQEAIHALVHAFGRVLMVDPKTLKLDHPIHCELNMAIIEGRDSKGCDCDGPEEPEESLDG